MRQYPATPIVRSTGTQSYATWPAMEYRIARPYAKLGAYRHRSSVVELSIRNPARPAHASAGRCVFNELREARDDWRWPETAALAPPLAPRWQGGEACGNPVSHAALPRDAIRGAEAKCFRALFE